MAFTMRTGRRKGFTLLCLVLIVFVLMTTLLPMTTSAEATEEKDDNKEIQHAQNIDSEKESSTLALASPEEKGDHVRLVNDDVMTAESTGTPREVPTREEDGWRRLSVSESVPRGAHVRLNMTSGEKWVKVDTIPETEAKQDDTSTRGEKILDLIGNLPYVEEAILKRIEAIRQSGNPGSEAFEAGAAALWDDRQAQLKASNDSSVGPAESRVSILAKLLTPELVTAEALTELDDLVDDLDEAFTFANHAHKGIEQCLTLIEHAKSSNEVKTLAAGVIGKTIKLTSELQNQTVALGGFDVIKRAFRNGAITETKALYSLGSLLRGSNEAAAEALRHPDFFQSLVLRLSRQGTEHKVREKAAALVGDLLMEPKEWCWGAFKQADLCHSSFDFTEREVSGNPHFLYLHEIRSKVCGNKQRDEM